VSSGLLVRARADALVDFEPININLGMFADATFEFDSEKAQVPFSGDEPDKVRVIIESRTSTTDTNEGSWTAWAEHRNRGELSMKYIQFRLHVVVESDAYGITIYNFQYAIDLPDKIVAGVSTAGSANPVTVNYPTDYFVAVKRLLCTLIGGANGDYFKVTAQNASSFTWEARNSAHSLITGTIHYEARGY
jgi:hypothetical protein